MSWKLQKNMTALNMYLVYNLALTDFIIQARVYIVSKGVFHFVEPGQNLLISSH